MYCKHCGAHLMESDKVCESCGRKIFKLPKLKKFILPILLIFAVCGYIYELNDKLLVQGMLKDSVDVFFAKVEEAEALQAENSKIISENNRLKTENKTLSSSNAFLVNQNADSKQKVYFLDNHIGIVVENGTKYHRLGCQHVKDKTFWAYNVELATARGYTPCSVCYK